MYEMMDTVVKNKVDAEADMWSAGWTSGMYSKDMFILTCLPTWGLNFCIKPGIPADEMDKAANTWGYMQAPIPYQNGGTWYGMYSKSENKDAAWAWIKTMTSNEDYLVNGLANTWEISQDISRQLKDVLKRDIQISLQEISSILQISMKRQKM